MTNSKRLGAVLLGVLAVAAMAAPAGAADVSAGADFNSAYIWRGITLNTNPVLQPWVDVSGIKLGEGASFGFNVWGNAPVTGEEYDLKRQFDEFDVTLTLSLPHGVKAGLIEYTVVGAPATRELFGSYSYAGKLNAGVSAFYDFGTVDDFYLSATVGKSFTIDEKTSVSVDGLIGMAGEDFALAYDGSKGGLYNYNLSGKLSYKATEKITLGAVVGYAGSLDKDVLVEQDQKVYGGASVSVVF